MQPSYAEPPHQLSLVNQVFPSGSASLLHYQVCLGSLASTSSQPASCERSWQVLPCPPCPAAFITHHPLTDAPKHPSTHHLTRASTTPFIASTDCRHRFHCCHHLLEPTSAQRALCAGAGTGWGRAQWSGMPCLTCAHTAVAQCAAHDKFGLLKMLRPDHHLVAAPTTILWPDSVARTTAALVNRWGSQRQLVGHTQSLHTTQQKSVDTVGDVRVVLLGTGGQEP